MEWLDYDKDTGVFTWKLSPVASLKKGSVAGTTQFSGYRVINISGKIYRCCRLAVLFETGAWPEQLVDHINGIRTDDRIANLRCVTSEQNAWNSRKPITNTSGKKGVTKSKTPGKWIAQITNKNRNMTIGTFDTLEEAAEAYDRTAIQMFGKYARTNAMMQANS